MTTSGFTSATADACTPAASGKVIESPLDRPFSPRSRSGAAHDRAGQRHRGGTTRHRSAGAKTAAMSDLRSLSQRANRVDGHAASENPARSTNDQCPSAVGRIRLSTPGQTCIVGRDQRGQSAPNDRRAGDGSGDSSVREVERTTSADSERIKRELSLAIRRRAAHAVRVRRRASLHQRTRRRRNRLDCRG